MADILASDISIIKKNLFRFSAPGSTIEYIQRLGGLTNHSYRVDIKGESYLVRLPGEGTEELVNRTDEKKSTELACNLGIDADLLYFGSDGLKISQYIPNAVTMSPAEMCRTENIKDAARLFSRLHSCGIDTGVPFDVFNMAESYEHFIRKNRVTLYDDYETIKESIKRIRNSKEMRATFLVPCHNDPLCENWVRSDKRLYLVDWEYAGMNDPLWDLADLSIEAHYGEKEDTLLLMTYFGRNIKKTDFIRFVANKLFLDFLWTLWGKTRVPFDGRPMEDYADKRYKRLKSNLNLFGS